MRFASSKEWARYRFLKILERSGVIKNLETQVRMPIVVCGIKVCTYVLDFRYEQDGKIVREDVKGYRKGAAYQIFRLKKKLIQAVYGETVVEV